MEWHFALTTPSQLSLLAAKHLNQGLFSDYYLNHVAPTLSEWESPELHAQAKALRDDLKTLLTSVMDKQSPLKREIGKDQEKVS
jgi:hypothetical protein